MTEERLAELERLEQAATPGPWDCITQPERDCLISTEKPDADGRHHSIVFAPHGKGWDAIEWGIKARNVQCIVAARNALPELLAEIERLRKVGSEMVNAIEQWANGEAGWSTRLRAAQEAARPVLGMGLACRKPTEDFDAERRARG